MSERAVLHFELRVPDAQASAYEEAMTVLASLQELAGRFHRLRAMVDGDDRDRLDSRGVQTFHDLLSPA